MKTNIKTNNLMFIAKAAVAALALVAGAAQADITIIDGPPTLTSTTDNVIFNTACDPDAVTSGTLLKGCLNSSHTTIVDFLGTESLVVNNTSGGQAQIKSSDADGFDYLKIYLDPLATSAFQTLIFNVDANNAVQDDTITINAVNTLGAATTQTFDLVNGQNFFTVLASNNQLINFVELSSTASLSDIEFSDVKQVRIGVGSAVPEPGSLPLLGLSLAGLAAIRRRKTA